MYSIKNFDTLVAGTINRSEIAKRTILSNLKTIDKETLARLCSAVNYGLYEFVIYGQKVNNMTYFEFRHLGHGNFSGVRAGSFVESILSSKTE